MSVLDSDIDIRISITDATPHMFSLIGFAKSKGEWTHYVRMTGKCIYTIHIGNQSSMLYVQHRSKRHGTDHKKITYKRTIKTIDDIVDCVNQFEK